MISKKQPLPLLNLLKQTWLLIGTPLLAAFLFWFFFQRETHGFAATVLSRAVIVDVRNGPVSGLDVKLDGTPINRLELLEIELANTGNRPIRREDFDGPLVFRFGGTVVGKPSVRPGNRVILSFSKLEEKGLQISPTLFNAGDKAAFRINIADAPTENLAVSLAGRIANVLDVSLRLNPESEKRSSAFGLQEFARLAVFITGALSLVIFIGKFRDLVKLRRDVEVAVKLEKEIEPTAKSRAHAVAKSLGIYDSDRKALMLFVRMKIESLLSQLAETSKTKSSRQLPTRILVRELAAQEIISPKTASAVSDLMPILNREVHQLESYVAESELNAIEELATTVIADLTSALRARVS